MKKILIGFTTLFLAILIVSCTNNAKKIDKALEDLKIGYQGGDNKDRVMYDLTLPKKSNDVDITWTSKRSDILKNDGKYVGDNDKDVEVTLVATASIKDDSKTKEFKVKVLSNLNSILNRIAIPQINADKTITMKANLISKIDNYNLTWKSSNSDVINPTTGAVKRPAFGEKNVEVILTVEFVKDGKTYSKEIEVTVLAYAKAIKVSGSIADVTTGTKTGDYVEVKGVTVFGITDDGYYITDSTKVIFVYDNIKANDSKKAVKLGKVYDIFAEVDSRFDTYQLKGTDSNPIEVINLANETAINPEIDETIKTVKDIADIKVPAAGSEHIAKYVEIDAIIEKDANETASNYNTYLVDINDKTKKVLVYYKSPLKDELAAKSGESVRIKVLIHSYRTDRLIWSINYIDKIEDLVILEKTKEQKLEAAEAYVKGLIKKQYFDVNETLVFAAENNGVAITWNSNLPNIDITTGKLTFDGENITTVTITANLKIDDLEKEIVIETEVGVLPLKSITDAKADTSNKFIRTQGTVAGLSGNNAYAIIDENGIGISLQAIDLKDKVGKNVVVTGIHNIFNGLHQLSNVKVESESAGITINATNMNDTILSESDLLGKQSTPINAKDLRIIKKVEGGTAYKHITLTLQDFTGRTISMRWEDRIYAGGRAILDTFEVGNFVEIENMILSWYEGPQFVYTGENQIKTTTPSDQMILLFEFYDYSQKLPGTVVKDGTIMIPDPTNPNVTMNVDHVNEGTLTGNEIKVTGEIGNVVEIMVSFTYGSEIYAQQFMVQIVGVSVLYYETDFEDATKDTDQYAAGKVATNGKEWIVDGTVLTGKNPAANDKQNGANALRLRNNGSNNGFAQLNEKISGLTKLEFNYANYGTNKDGRVKVEISLDGANWIEIWVQAETKANLTAAEIIFDYNQAAFANNNITSESEIYVRFAVDGPNSNNSRVNIDDIKFYK